MDAPSSHRLLTTKAPQVDRPRVATDAWTSMLGLPRASIMKNRPRQVSSMRRKGTKQSVHSSHRSTRPQERVRETQWRGLIRLLTGWTRAETSTKRRGWPQREENPARSRTSLRETRVSHNSISPRIRTNSRVDLVLKDPSWTLSLVWLRRVSCTRGVPTGLKILIDQDNQCSLNNRLLWSNRNNMSIKMKRNRKRLCRPKRKQNLFRRRLWSRKRLSSRRQVDRALKDLYKKKK